MKIIFKLTEVLLQRVKEDLRRPHPFAFERVGFISSRSGRIPPNGWVILGYDYHPVDDEDYVPCASVGALIGPGAMRKALQVAYNEPLSMVHVHSHDHRGTPAFSKVDLRESARFVPNVWNVRPNLPHAAIVLSEDSLCGFGWEPGSQRRIPIGDFTIVGVPLRIIRKNT